MRQFEYDGAGNLVSDGLQRMSYDVTGQQVLAVAGGYRLEQWYDGDRLRVKKRDGGEEVYYVRSSVLGGQVVAEIRNGGGVWSWSRGCIGREESFWRSRRAGRSGCSRTQWRASQPIPQGIPEKYSTRWGCPRASFGEDVTSPITKTEERKF